MTKWLRRLLCLHLRWRRTLWDDEETLLQVAACTGQVSWTCCVCGKTKLCRAGEGPVNYVD